LVKKLLSDPEVDPNIRDEYGRTALEHAAYHGYVEIVRLLLSYPKINVNIQNKNDRIIYMKNKDGKVELVNENGKTALIIAAINGYVDVIKELLAHKNINVNIKDTGGKTALDLAKSDEIKQLLQKHESE
jgi:ankyrin repeat protein